MVLEKLSESLGKSVSELLSLVEEKIKESIKSLQGVFTEISIDSQIGFLVYIF